MRHPTKEETARASELVSPHMLPLLDSGEVWVVLDAEAGVFDVDEALREWRLGLRNEDPEVKP